MDVRRIEGRLHSPGRSRQYLQSDGSHGTKDGYLASFHVQWAERSRKALSKTKTLARVPLELTHPPRHGRAKARSAASRTSRPSTSCPAAKTWIRGTNAKPRFAL